MRANLHRLIWPSFWSPHLIYVISWLHRHTTSAATMILLRYCNSAVKAEWFISFPSPPRLTGYLVIRRTALLRKLSRHNDSFVCVVHFPLLTKPHMLYIDLANNLPWSAAIARIADVVIPDTLLWWCYLANNCDSTAILFSTKFRVSRCFPGRENGY